MRKPLLVLVLGLTLVACGKNDSSADIASSAAPTTESVPSTVTVTDADNGKERTLAVGERLSVALPANPSTGYSWQLTGLDQNVVRQLGDPDFRPVPNVPVAPGSGGTSMWTFVGNAAGVTTLSLEYARPWEVGAEPAQRFSLTIKVE